MTTRTDVFSPEKRSAVMRSVKSGNTKPEIALRKALHAQGLRYRIHAKDLPGKPDIVLPKYRTAIFVHGCFWHGHDCKRGAREPKTNVRYWREKIARNKARDIKNRAALESDAWRVITVWECEIRALDAASLALDIRQAKIPQTHREKKAAEQIEPSGF